MPNTFIITDNDFPVTAFTLGNDKFIKVSDLVAWMKFQQTHMQGDHKELLFAITKILIRFNNTKQHNNEKNNP